MINPAIWARLLKYVQHGDETSIAEVLGNGDLSTLVVLLDGSIKLAAKAMTGGHINRADTELLDRLCKMIGHEP